MKILSVTPLALPEVKVIRFARFRDHRGYFTETFRQSDLHTLSFLAGARIMQGNESVSRAGVVRGLHYQWSPHMGKLVRTLSGRMVDIILDIRMGSPTYGKRIAYEMPADLDADFDEWIWIPPGFAHGNYFSEDSRIEYLCTGEYSQGKEAGISPLAHDIDDSLMDAALKAELHKAFAHAIMTDKDRAGLTLAQWKEHEAAHPHFSYKDLQRED